MARKTSTKPTRIWKFGALAPTTNSKAVGELLFQSRRYYNELIEIERAKQARYAAIRRATIPGLTETERLIAKAEAELDTLFEAVRKWRQRHYVLIGEKTLKVPPHLEREIREVKSRLGNWKPPSGLRGQEKRYRAAFEAELKPLREHAERRRKELDAEWRKQSEKTEDCKIPPRVAEELNAALAKELLSADQDSAFSQILVSERTALAAVKEARRRRLDDGSVTPGCKLAMDEAAKTAVQKRRERGQMPGFKAFDGGGRIVVQINPEISVGELFSGKNGKIRLRQAGPPMRRRDGKQPRTPRASEYFVASIRIGTTKGKAPVWADFPVRIHRKLPEDAAVKWAAVVVRREGNRKRYELQLTLEARSFAQPNPLRPRGSGRVALNVGWRLLPDDRVRVAYWVTDDGRRGEITVSVDQPEPVPGAGKRIATWRKAGILQRIAYADELQSVADKHANRAVRYMMLLMRLSGNLLTNWRTRGKTGNWRTRGKVGRGMRRVLAQAAAHFFGSDGLRKEWVAWRDARTAEHLDLLCSPIEALRFAKRYGWTPLHARVWWLYLWLRKDQHLTDWSVRQRQNGAHERTDHYRRELIRLFTGSGEIVTDNTNLAHLSEHPKTSDEDEREKRVQERQAYTRKCAAPGSLRAMAREMFGAHSQIVSSIDNTRRCADCGKVLKITGHIGSCACGVVRDTDENNCLNLLRRARGEWFSDEREPGPARHPEMNVVSEASGRRGDPDR